MRVVAPETDDVATSTLKADRQPTIHDLLTHMSGFSYAGNRTEAHKKWPASSATAARTYTGSEFIDIMSEAPLLHQPGALWDYSLSVDVLGLVIETVAGTSLGHFMDERLWKPLGMVDTAFAVPTAKRSRYAQPLPNDPLTGADQSMLHQSKEPLKFECGGGCAVSTAMDYLRFAQMLANKGSLDGHRILLRKTVELMTSDQIAHDVRERSSYSILAQGHSFGLGLAVRTHSAPTALAGSVGDFGWGGASGTYFWVDPQEELAVVFMAATPSEIRNHFRALVRNLVLASIMD
jgi:CubicO group peptidase (beta-lactamase class C family)